MQKIFKGTALLLLMSIMIAGMNSCNKTFSDPPVIGNPDIVANTTISSLKARYTSGAPVAIADEVILAGIVWIKWQP